MGATSALGTTTSPETQAEQDAISKMRGVYESFFTSRYSLEQEFPFRLISIRDTLAPYQADTNVLSNVLEFDIDKRLQDVDADKIKGTLISALAPVLYTLTTTDRDKIDIFSIASQVSGKALKDLLSIRSEITKALTKHQRENITYRLYLAPYRKTDARLVYNEQKIDMVRYGHVSLLNDQRTTAQETIAHEIDLQRANLYYSYNRKQTAPSFLAAGMHFVFSKDSATLNCEILVHLYPRSFPYKDIADNIQFREIVIPAGEDFRHPVALLKMEMPIYQTGEAVDPTLTNQFGNFAGIKDYRFILAEQKNRRFTPYLLGHLNKFKPLDVKFQFQTVLLSLRTLQAETVNMVFAPSFRVGSLLQANLGGYTLKKVDEEFKTTINESLREAKQKALDKVTLELQAKVKAEMETRLTATAKNKEVSDLIKNGVMFGLEKILAQAESRLTPPSN
ncbi:MAG: hypothetical protein OYH77_02935 [Pseudomonadota bacterium]|nr:hypothetical protein [Pseudomonadota bacterium]